MKFKFFPGRSSLERSAWPALSGFSLLLLGAAGMSARGQGIVAGAQLTGVSLGRGQYAYTLTLENSPTSTAHIGMFWFAWEAGQADFLTSEPYAIQTPAGWNSVVEGGGGEDGYSIQFVTFTSPLAPGGSETFTFDSPDSPAVMAGPASLYPEYETMTSQVYSGHAASGLQDVFLTQVVVPEPATWTLLGVGAIGLAIFQRRK